ncbi:MFS transporter [Streptomyces venezuelae]|uniref:MFS transporter n=1 Tax=Streptomyces venezuelae TaxID=54571 RepID=UPI00341C8E5C
MTTHPVLDPPVAPARYRTLLAAPHIARLLTGAIVGHLPVAMAPLALLQVVRADGGSLTTASLLAALYGLGAALGQPIWGRVLDRHGPARALLTTCGTSTLAFTALACLSTDHQLAVATVLTVVAAVFTPPLEAAARVLWPKVTTTEDEFRAVLSLDASAQEVVFIAGPLLVLGTSAAAGPHATLFAAALIGIAGTLAFLTAPPARTRHIPDRGAMARGSWLGPLYAPGPRALALALLGAGVALGALNVAALELADAHASPALATLIPAALAVGSLTGGLVYGRRRWPGPAWAHLLTASCGLLSGLVLFTAGPSPALTVLAAVAPGMFLAPLLVMVFASLDHLTLPGTVGEAAATMIACLGLGQAAGTALAGADTVTPTTIALMGGAATCLTVAARRRSLAEPAQHA